MWCAGCYICAYKPTARPREQHPLTAGSSVGPNDPLASCKTCSGWVCSVHGSRYSAFECALCNAGKAAQEALAPDGGPRKAAAAAFARDAGRWASDSDLEQARRVVGLIQAEQRKGSRSEEHREFIDGDPTGNLVYGLATVLRESLPDDVAKEFDGETRLFWQIPKVQGAEQFAASPKGEFGGISVDAVGATVAAVFSEVEISPRPDAERVIYGAALLALSLADEDTATRLSESGPEGEIQIKAPWEVSHPVLLDPVMWMVLTAYRRS
jgi:hypothetical protein